MAQTTGARHEFDPAPSLVPGRMPVTGTRRVDCEQPRRSDPMVGSDVPQSESGATGDTHVGGRPDFADLVDEWGLQSFPASDPPANW
jgi:hypothetical protein